MRDPDLERKIAVYLKAARQLAEREKILRAEFPDVFDHEVALMVAASHVVWLRAAAKEAGVDVPDMDIYFESARHARAWLAQKERR